MFSLATLWHGLVTLFIGFVAWTSLSSGQILAPYGPTRRSSPLTFWILWLVLAGTALVFLLILVFRIGAASLAAGL
jgi:hypothetical protein